MYKMQMLKSLKLKNEPEIYNKLKNLSCSQGLAGSLNFLRGLVTGILDKSKERVMHDLKSHKNLLLVSSTQAMQQCPSRNQLPCNLKLQTTVKICRPPEFLVPLFERGKKNEVQVSTKYLIFYRDAKIFNFL